MAREKLDTFGLLDPQPDFARAGGWFLLAALTVVLLLGVDVALPAQILAPQQRRCC